MNSLADRTAIAIVTGGGWNVGRGVALGLAKAGARVVVASRNRDNLDESVRLIEAAGGEAFARPTDVTDLADVEGLVEDTLACEAFSDSLDPLWPSRGICWGATQSCFPHVLDQIISRDAVGRSADELVCEVPKPAIVLQKEFLVVLGSSWS